MNRLPWAGLLALLAGAWFLLPGCGSSDPVASAPVPDTLRIDLNDGVWRVQTTSLRDIHCDSTAQATVQDTTIGVCSLVFISGSIEPLGLTCASDRDDSTFTFLCDQERDLSPCVVNLRTTGSGSYTRMGYTMTLTRVSSVRGDPICPSALPTFADPCTLTVIETGVFVDAANDSIRGCTDDSTGTKAFLDRVLLPLGD